MRTKEEKIKAKTTHLAVRNIRRARRSIKESREFLKISPLFMDEYDRKEWEKKAERVNELLSEADSILLDYIRRSGILEEYDINIYE